MSLKLANSRGRAALICGERVVDLAERSDGRFSADPMEAVARFEDVAAFAASVDPEDGDEPLDESALGPCVPRP